MNVIRKIVPLSLTVLLITACGDDYENTPDVDNRQGIMKGEFIGNGWEISDDQEIELKAPWSSNIPLKSNEEIDINYQSDWYSYIWGNLPVEPGNDNWTINICLHPLNSVGSWFVSNTHFDANEGTLQVCIDNNGTSYYPLKHKAFKFMITDDSGMPPTGKIRCNMEGSLYNSDNIKDSIILKNVSFEIRNILMEGFDY